MNAFRVRKNVIFDKELIEKRSFIGMLDGEIGNSGYKDLKKEYNKHISLDVSIETIIKDIKNKIGYN